MPPETSQRISASRNTASPVRHRPTFAVNGMGDIASRSIGLEPHSRNVNFRLAHLRGREAGGIAKFGDPDNLSQFVSHMGGLGDAVVLRRQSDGPQHQIAEGRFAAGVAVPVEKRKEKGADPAMNGFAAQEDPFPGNEAVVENGVGIGRSGREPALEILAVPQIVDGHDLFDPFPVTRNRKRRRPSLFRSATESG